MKKSDQLKQDKQALVKKMQDLNTQIETRSEKKGVYSEEEATTFDGYQADIDRTDAAIQRALTLEELQAQNSSEGDTISDSSDNEYNKILKRYSLHKAIRSQLPGGLLDGVELEMHQEALHEIRNLKNSDITVQGVLVPNTTRSEKQSVTKDDGNYGGKLVYEEFKGIIEALQPKPIVESLGASYMRGLRGPASFTTDLKGIVASWEDEDATVDSSASQYGKKTMNAKRLSATVPITVQNLHQSVIDLELRTANEIRLATERAIDLSVINGAGTGFQPLGILNLSGVNTLVMGDNGGAPTWKSLVDMVTLIENEDAGFGTISYLINPLTKGFLKTTLHTAGDSKYLMSQDSTINGLNTGISTFVPKNLEKGTGTNLSAAIAGDFSQVMIGEWGFSDMVVDNITRKKEGLIEITNNQYVDCLVSHEKSFTVIKDFDLS